MSSTDMRKLIDKINEALIDDDTINDILVNAAQRFAFNNRSKPGSARYDAAANQAVLEAMREAGITLAPDDFDQARSAFDDFVRDYF